MDRGEHRDAMHLAVGADLNVRRATISIRPARIWVLRFVAVFGFISALVAAPVSAAATSDGACVDSRTLSSGSKGAP